MKTVLLIDDLRVFRKVEADTTLYVARNSGQALAILEAHPDEHWDEIWFDHDLGTVNDAIDTTLPVVDYLAEKAFFGNPVSVGLAYVHSSNPVGVKAILATLQRYDYKTERVNPDEYFRIDPVLYWAR